MRRSSASSPRESAPIVALCWRAPPPPRSFPSRRLPRLRPRSRQRGSMPILSLSRSRARPSALRRPFLMPDPTNPDSGEPVRHLLPECVAIAAPYSLSYAARAPASPPLESDVTGLGLRRGQTLAVDARGDRFRIPPRSAESAAGPPYRAIAEKGVVRAPVIPDFRSSAR